MKKLIGYITLIFFLCGYVTVHAQTKPQNNNVPYNMLLCIDAEQMLNKAGFDNLLQQVFNPASREFRNDTEKATKLRKTFAAMYGAGIDLDKKIWMSFYSGKNDVKDSLQLALDSIDKFANKYSYRGYSNAFSNFSYILHIPVGNRQVLEKCILDLASIEESSEEVFRDWQKIGNTSYVQKDEVIMAINDKVCMIAYKNFKLNSYRYEAPRKILQVDTVKNEYYIKPTDANNKKNRRIDTNYIVDKINTNGEVIRVKPTIRKTTKKNYDYSETEEVPKNYPIDTDMSAATDTTVAVAVPRIAPKKPKKTTVKNKTIKPKRAGSSIRQAEKEDSNYNSDYAVPEPAQPIATTDVAPYVADTTKPVRYDGTTIDTTGYNAYEYEDTDTEYRDSVNIITKFKKRTFTPIEQDSIDAIFTNRNAKVAKAFLQQIFQKMEQPQFFDKTTDTIAAKMLQAKNDMSFYSDTEVYERYYGLTSLLYGVRNAMIPSAFSNGSYETTFNSEPGKMALYALTNFGDSAYNNIKSIYKPLTNNWPANFGTRSKAQFQTNINVQALITYLRKDVFAEMKKDVDIDAELAKYNITEQDIANAFTGEIYAYANTTVSKKAYKRKDGREEFVGGLALRIKNKETAVTLMNKLASINKRDVMYEKYAFDKTGTYLIFVGSDDDVLYAEDIAKQMNSNTDPEIFTVQANEIMRMHVDVQGLTKSLVGTSEKSNIYNYFVNQIGSLRMASLYSGKNGFANTIEMEAGKDGLNPLAMMVEMLRMYNEQREKDYKESAKAPKTKYSRPKAPVKKTTRATPRRK